MKNKEFSQQLVELEPGLKVFSRRLTKNELDAKDLLQETFLKALYQKDKFIDNTSLRSWTFRIMQNIFINSYRIKFRYEYYDNLSEILPDKNYDFPDLDLNLEYINSKIESLNNVLKYAFELYLKGFKYLEIAAALEISVGTAKSRVFYAKKYLKKNLIDFQFN